MANPIRVFWRRISDGLAIAQLWSHFRLEARASYEIYSKEVDATLPEAESRWTQSLQVIRVLFWAMLTKLSPGRRVMLLISLVLLAVPIFTFRYQGLSFWGGAGLLMLLALELADRVMMKRDLEIAREIQNWMMPAAPPQLQVSILRSLLARPILSPETTTTLSFAQSQETRGNDHLCQSGPNGCCWWWPTSLERVFPRPC